MQETNLYAVALPPMMKALGALLRKNGVDIGKKYYINDLPLKDL
jgi:hypothetical protein